METSCRLKLLHVRLKRFVAWTAFAIASCILFAPDLFAQYYEYTLKQRRKWDQIHVEVWARALTSSAPVLGDASLVVSYNTTFLQPTVEATANFSVTDSVQFDVDVAIPVVTTASQFHAANGFKTLGSLPYESGPTKNLGLEVRLNTLGIGGVTADSTGRGSFVGKVIFDIIGSPTDSTLTDVVWNTSTTVGDIRIFDVDGNDIEDSVSFVNPDDFTIVGITVLNPNGPSEVVDRDKIYQSVGTSAAGGYPIYFERSGLNIGAQPSTRATAYVFEYSLNGGTSWTEFGRVAETIITTGTIATSASVSLSDFVSGEISTTADGPQGRIITTSTGASLSTTNSVLYRQMLRVVWSTDATFAARSEEVRLRITQLSTTTGANIQSRPSLTPQDISDTNFVIGRLFFVQLDGSTKYLRSSSSFSNPTQLTVETWINLNSYQPVGSEPGIIASSASDAFDEEGPFMLYLKDGRFPAFRAREQLDRGVNGYVGDISAPNALDTASSATPLGASHSTNWVHLAGTVANDTLTLFVNGEIAAQSTNDSATNIRMQVKNYPIWLGVNPNISIESTDFLDAGLKGTRVWRNALTQDEIRQRVAGISNPTVTSATFSIHRTLEIYYTLEGVRTDAALETAHQEGSNDADQYVDGQVDNGQIRFRPDQPHLTLTAPVGGEGVSNRDDERFEVRWVGFGLGDIINSTTADIDLQFSLDQGTTWTYARGTATSTTGSNLGGPNGTQVNIESGSATWEPFNNDGDDGDDAGIQNLQILAGGAYSDQAIFRIRGRTGGDTNVTDISGAFTVAPFFSLQTDENTLISVENGEPFSITGQSAFLEAWIAPYRFPTPTEGWFPIINKTDTASGTSYYSLRLLSTGQLEFRLTDENGVERVAQSDITKPLVEPNEDALDSPWTHVGVYLNLGNGVGQSDIRFYIDGSPQSADTSITNQLGDSLAVQELNQFPVWLGCEIVQSTTGSSTVCLPGKYREIRFWNGSPANSSVTGSVEPTQLTQFVQGAQAANGADLTGSNATNLVAALALTGGSFINNGFSQSFGSNSATIVPRFTGSFPSYVAEVPYLKLVEPIFNQRVRNTERNLSVRWVGFDYSGVTTGSVPAESSLEFSIRGGGGELIQPYQSVASPFWNSTQASALSLGTTASTIFDPTGLAIQYAATLDVLNADPDPDDDEAYDATTGPLSATLTNARFRLTATTATVVSTIRSEGPLFTIVPPSNFTVRALLEGYHRGSTVASITDISSTFSSGGVKISLYEDNAGTPGSKVAEAESEFQYDDIMAAITGASGRGAEGSVFANIPFIFTDLQDGNYWVVVEHLNHLPVMSRFPAPFDFTGDDATTWSIESGWDFQAWSGNSANVLLNTTTDSPYTPSTTAGKYTAFGNSINVTQSTLPGYSETGLIYNQGVSGLQVSSSSLTSLVGGDVERDGQINSGDRVQVRADAGTSLVRSDVTGDGNINSLDREIVDRNHGKVSSILIVDFPSSMPDNNGDGQGGTVEMVAHHRDPLSVISPIDPVRSQQFNDAARAHFASIEAGEKVADLKTKSGSGDKLQAGPRYIATAEPRKVGLETIEIPMYVRSVGSRFGLGNATFAITFNSNLLSYEGLQDISNVPWHNKPAQGYGFIKSAPEDTVDKPLADVRTIEIDYDALDRPTGTFVPSSKTAIGKLVFRIKNPETINRPLEFSWHNSTAILATDGRLITGNGTFEQINTILPYTVTLHIPNGGEQWRGGREYAIQWTNERAELIRLEYSLDLGATWQPMIPGDVEARDRNATWRIPSDVRSDEAMVRVIDEQTGLELDRSDDVFSIQPITAAISRPASVDPAYIGQRSERIEWATTGLETVHFEFSANGVNGWTKVTADRDATSGSARWTIPSGINTKDAVIRMVDTPTGEVVATSSKFKVLAGLITFLAPRSSDVLNARDESRVRWQVENVEQFDMDYSVDGGNSWAPVDDLIEAEDRFLNWAVPNVNTDQAVLRAFIPGDPELEYNRTPEFTIQGASSVRVEDRGFALYQANPNPMIVESVIRFAVGRDESVTLNVFDAMGEKVMSLIDNEYYTEGAYDVRFNAKELPAGVYFVRMHAGSFSAMIRVVALK